MIRFLCAVLAAALALTGTQGAWAASCIAPESARLRALSDLVYRDPHRALDADARALAATGNRDVQTRAWLHALNAEAYWLLSDSGALTRETTAGFATGVRADDPAYPALLIRSVLGDFSSGVMRPGEKQLLVEMRRWPHDGAEYLCMQSVLGFVQMHLGEASAGAENIIAPYTATDDAVLPAVHNFAANNLAKFMAGAMNYAGAADLYKEKIAFDTAAHYDFAREDDQYFIAKYLILSGHYAEAAPYLRATEASAAHFGDRLGLVYDHEQECHLRVGLNDYAAAGPLCESVGRQLRPIDPGVYGDNLVQQAQIMVGEGQPRRAIPLLAAAARAGAGNASFPLARLYQVSVSAHEALGDIRAALQDLKRYVAIEDTQNAATQSRLNMAHDVEMAYQRQNYDRRVQAEKGASRDRVLKISLFGSLAIAVMAVLSHVALRRKNGAIRRMSQTDALTGLYNRRAVHEVLAGGALLGRAEPGYVAVLIDLDHFKGINDTFGHLAGDLTLQALAGLFGSELRRGDIAGRWGGEEFVILMRGASLSAAGRVVARLRKRIEQVEIPGFPAVRVSFSAGLCTLADARDLETALARCDEALYAAKHAGRAQSHVWTGPGEATEFACYDEAQALRLAA